ncbi:MAG: HU family DNA-binding protein [Pseudomonadota bacterium]
MKKRDLLEKVADQSGLKKNETRRAVEATLNSIRDALEAGEDINIAPLGRIKVKTRGEGAAASKIYRVILKKPAEPVSD